MLMRRMTARKPSENEDFGTCVFGDGETVRFTLPPSTEPPELKNAIIRKAPDGSLLVTAGSIIAKDYRELFTRPFRTLVLECSILKALRLPPGILSVTVYVKDASECQTQEWAPNEETVTVADIEPAKAAVAVLEGKRSAKEMMLLCQNTASEQTWNEMTSHGDADSEQALNVLTLDVMARVVLTGSASRWKRFLKEADEDVRAVLNDCKD